MDWLVHLFIGAENLRGSATKQWTVVLMSMVIFLVIYLACLLLSQLSRTYRELSSREKVFWHLSIVRAFFGVFSAYAGFWSLIYEPELFADVVRATTRRSYFCVAFSSGFFLFECGMLFTSNIVFRFIDWNLAFHHLVVLIGYLIGMYTEANHFFGCVGLLLEITTPFSATCWLLIKAKKADTWLWRANQHVLVHLFHCRTTVELYLWWVTFSNLELVYNHMPLLHGLHMYTGLLIFTVYLTPFWTYKKTWQIFNPTDWNHQDTKKKS